MGLLLKSISLTLNGQADVGSLYCRIDAQTPINPMTEVSKGNILVGVFVPALLGENMSITIQVDNTEDTDIYATIQATEISESLLGNVYFSRDCFLRNSTTEISGSINTTQIKQYAWQTCRFQQQWEWFCFDDALQQFYLMTTTAYIYVIHDLPVSPWKAKFPMYNPYEANYIWTSLLDICCKACEEYSEVIGHPPDTLLEHVEAYTYGLNHNPHFRYDVINGASYYSLKSNAGQIAVKLQKYIQDHQYLYNKLNCSDCATLVQIECRACGIEITNAIMWGQQHFPDINHFDTNPIIAIGYQDWEIPFSGPKSHGGFSYHEFNSNNLRDKTSPVYDACLKIDMSEYPSSMPSERNDKTPFLPLGIPFAATDNPMVQVDPKQPYSSDLPYYRERLVSDGQNCLLDNIPYTIAYIDVFTALQEETVLVEGGYLDNIRIKYELQDNPLPESGRHKKIQNPDLWLAEVLKGNHRLMENYGRNKVYQLWEDDTEFRLELTFSFNEREAYAQLLYALAGIANPNIQRVDLGDIAFAIGNRFYLFVKNNVLVRISNETEGSDVSAETIAHNICNSL